MLWCSVALLALFASVQGRAVNISNTWVLPEEGFPVFYRYFRDRISWYEADAVCQFHHANLVTVDTTAQYDAVRAYLKELDISSAVWVGLIRSNPDGDFTWTDYRGLSGEGYWSSAPDARAAPLCAAADPAADYRWEARACGGPTVASFICELPVPQWALGSEGCMVRALPALTILYLPESAAVQLTADCGLAGVKRVQCTGNVKREDLLKDLSCTEEQEATTVASVTSSGSTWSVTTDSVITDQDTTTETTTEDSATTEHEDDINQSSTMVPSTTNHNLNIVTEYKLPTKPLYTNKFNRINNNLHKNLDLTHNNNLQSNYIPKIANGDNYLSNEQLDKIEDEKHMQHKMLHEEIARLGNLENIFTQPTDHFVPPLVMAKAKISDDMTVLSLQEKHAQQLAEHHLSKQNGKYGQNEHIYENNIIKSTTQQPKVATIDKMLFMQTMKSKDNIKKDKIKISMPKKYNDKIYDPKSKIQKTVEMKPMILGKTADPTYSQTEFVTKHTETTSLPLVGRLDDDDDDDSSLDLTVLLKDSPEVRDEKTLYNYSGDISRLEVVKNSTLNNETEIKFYDVEATEDTKQENNEFEERIQNVTLNHEVINITIISEEHPTPTPTVFEITTKVLMVEDNTSIKPLPIFTEKPVNGAIITTTTSESPKTTIKSIVAVPFVNVSIDSVPSNLNDTAEAYDDASTITKSPITTSKTEVPMITTTLTSNNVSKLDKYVGETTTTTSPYITHEENVDNFNEDHEEFGAHSNSSYTFDDFNSPLLSGANEPVRRPNRSRRPQPPPNRNKFNPFRILG